MALKCDAKDGATCSESGLEKSKGGCGREERASFSRSFVIPPA